jgi:spermidine dehydrogenase
LTRQTRSSRLSSRRDQHRAGRADLLQTTFETFERRTRDLLARALAGSGFYPARDILGLNGESLAARLR